MAEHSAAACFMLATMSVSASALMVKLSISAQQLPVLREEPCLFYRVEAGLAIKPRIDLSAEVHLLQHCDRRIAPNQSEENCSVPKSGNVCGNVTGAPIAQVRPGFARQEPQPRAKHAEPSHEHSGRA
jgi:hypothetical protein